MIRVQIYVDDDEDRWLEERARQRGTTKSALIREGIETLRERDAKDIEHMLSLIGMIKDPDPEGATDVSERHDWYLTEWEQNRNLASVEE